MYIYPNTTKYITHKHALLSSSSYRVCLTYGCLCIYAGHFLPEEDDKFLERVRAAVEEEEQQVIMAADMDAAKDAIATVEQSRKTTENFRPDSKDQSSDRGESRESKDQTISITDAVPSSAVTNKEPGKQVSQGEGYSGAYDAVANLPIEFYHYYHGSNTDMGTLIEVAFCRLPIQGPLIIFINMRKV